MEVGKCPELGGDVTVFCSFRAPSAHKSKLYTWKCQSLLCLLAGWWGGFTCPVFTNSYLSELLLVCLVIFVRELTAWSHSVGVV